MAKRVKKVKGKRAWAVVYRGNTVVDPQSISYVKEITEAYFADVQRWCMPDKLNGRIVCISIPTVPLTPKKKASRK